MYNIRGALVLVVSRISGQTQANMENLVCAVTDPKRGGKILQQIKMYGDKTVDSYWRSKTFYNGSLIMR